uniref:ATP synthase F0 subunit 8 n=1 Tax=Pista cristata TaxID=279652 RepID=B3TJZ5_9ANNE|nr:ATP synthase F0 subunit 8 [Pista cristata]
MPHLSPMTWLIAPILFCSFMLPMIIATLWWTQTPIFPEPLSSSPKITLNNWNWS